MTKELIDNIMQEYLKCSYEGEEFDLREALEKHLLEPKDSCKRHDYVKMECKVCCKCGKIKLQGE